MTRRSHRAAVLLALAAAAGARAQQAQPDENRVWDLQAGKWDVTATDDYEEWLFGGAFRFVWPRLGIEVHGQQGILLLDRDEVGRLLAEREGSGLPRRSVPDPDPRRVLTADVLARRIASFLRAAGQGPEPLGDLTADRRAQLGLRLPRLLYFEGGVTVQRQGMLVARADRLWISPLDDRMELEGVELRYATPGRDGQDHTLVVRAPRMVKQGERWTGRNATVTSCTAGQPHVAVLSGEVEVIERGEQFEVWSRGNRLQFSGTSVLPIPDAHFFTGEQSEFPIKSASAGYSSAEGARVGVDVGLQYNSAGGALHEWLTGRPAHEFRGDWLLGINYVEARGVPLDGRVTYRAEGLYEGSLEGFWLDDQGQDRREIVSRIDGSPIDDTDRTLVRTRNRVHLGERTHLDLTLFRAADPAVYSEFHGGDYRNLELPETSAYLHSRSDNRLFTLGGRWNLDEFSYADDRSLAPAFTEELPVSTFHLVSQPIGMTPWDTPIVLDTASELGQRRSDFDDRFGMRVADRTFRADQLVELSAPFPLGVLTLRPYASLRGTWYDSDVVGDSTGRMAYETGVRAGTRMSRTWRWLDRDGNEDGLRHVLAPSVALQNRFRVDGEPGEFRQFDDVDALDEETRVRFEARNLLQRMEPGPDGPYPRDFLFVDLAQNLFPNSARDNGGEQLGLFEYELLVRPRTPGLPLDNLAFGVEGEHDWRTGMRTFNTELRFGKVAGFDWTLEYRTDRAVDGAAGLGASTQMFGRWDVFAGAQRDLQTDDWLGWSGGLVRRDHDWQIMVWAAYQPLLDEVTFRIDFTPRLFGQVQPRQPDWYGSSRLHGPGSAADF